MNLSVDNFEDSNILLRITILVFIHESGLPCLSVYAFFNTDL
jgi:hypothetical protein